MYQNEKLFWGIFFYGLIRNDLLTVKEEIYVNHLG